MLDGPTRNHLLILLTEELEADGMVEERAQVYTLNHH